MGKSLLTIWSRNKALRDTIADLDDKFKHDEEAQYRQLREWELNGNFIMNRQWMFWNDVTQSLQTYRKPPKGRQQVTENRLEQWLWNRVAKLTQSKPWIEAIAANIEGGSINAAEIGNLVIQWMWHNYNMSKVQRDLTIALSMFGTAFLKVTFNSDFGDEVMLKEEVSGKQTTIGMTGDIALEVCMPHEIFPASYAKDMETCHHLFHCRGIPPEVIDDIWGPEAVDASIKYGKKHSQQILNRLRHTVPSDFSNIYYPQEEDMCEVKEYFELPSKKHPKGRRMIYTGDYELVPQEDLPPFYLKEAKFGLIPFYFHKYPFKFWGETTLSLMRYPQERLNRLLSRGTEQSYYNSTPPILNPTGSGVTASKFTGEPFAVIDITPGHDPHFMQPPNPNPVLKENIDHVLMALQEIGSQHEVSKGDVPAAGLPYIGIQFLAERDDTPLGPVINNLAEQISLTVRTMLKIVQQKFVAPRTLKIVGRHFVKVLQDFEGTMIDENLGIYVNGESMMPMSKALNEQLVMMRLKAGLMTNLEARERLAMPTSSTFDIDYRLNIMRAEQENDGVRNNQLMLYSYTDANTGIRTQWDPNSGKGLLEVKEYEWHEVHIVSHTRILLSPEVEKWSDMQVVTLEQHLRQHKLALQPPPQMPTNAQQNSPNLPPQGNPPPPSEAGMGSLPPSPGETFATGPIPPNPIQEQGFGGGNE